MSERFIANVLTRDRFDVSAQFLAERITGRFGGHDVAARVLVPSIQGKTGFILALGAVHVAVAFEDFAMPFDELRPPETERRDRVGLLTDHRAHAMLGVLSTHQGREDALRVALAMLQVAAVLSETAGASAVLWSAAQTLTAVETFRAAVAAWSESVQTIPLTILVRFAGYQDGIEGPTPRFGVFGTGLQRFIGREIEFAPKALPLADMFNSMGLIASWVMQGLVVEDGHTYGRSASELIRVHYRDEGLVLKRPVLMCEIERLDEDLRQRAS